MFNDSVVLNELYSWLFSMLYSVFEIIQWVTALGSDYCGCQKNKMATSLNVLYIEQLQSVYLQANKYLMLLTIALE